MVRLILILFYIISNALLLFFNWELFTTTTNVDFVFTRLYIMPFVVVQLIGLLILLIFWAVEHVKDTKQELETLKLRKSLIEVQNEKEIALLKEKLSNKIMDPPGADTPAEDLSINK